MNTKEHGFMIERISRNGTRVVCWRGESFEAGLARLKSYETNMRHELWSHQWVETKFGYAPMASIN